MGGPQTDTIILTDSSHSAASRFTTNAKKHVLNLPLHRIQLHLLQIPPHGAQEIEANLLSTIRIEGAFLISTHSVPVN